MSITYTGPHKKGDIKKVVLAYSGGLDTSVILKWLQTAYGCEVVTFTADLGQGEELSPARKKAEMLGIKPENIIIDDVREEFVRDFVFPMFRANALYEGQYLLGTSIARPLIAKGNAGIPKYHDGHIHYDGTPELMADYAVLARDAGVKIIGGCCGTMPEHLKAMRHALETRAKGPKPSVEDIQAQLGAFSSAKDGTGDTSGDPKRERRGRRG